MSGRPKVVVTDFITDSLEIERRILRDVADVVAVGANHEDDLIGKIEDADAGDALSPDRTGAIRPIRPTTAC